MMWEDFINAFADMLGVDSTNGGIILSLLITMIAVAFVNMKRKPEPIISIGIILVSTVMFTVAGWYPLIVGAALGMVFSVLIAWYVSQITKGGR